MRHFAASEAWVRHPLTVAAAISTVLATLGCYGSCPDDLHTTRIHVSDADLLERLYPSGQLGELGFQDCAYLCESYLEADSVEACELLSATLDTGLASATVDTSDTSDAGDNVVRCTYTKQCYGGRLHAGVVASARPGGTVGDQLARMAELELAAVHAFGALAEELEQHGAPEALVRRARSAALEEARHAVLVGRLALSRGAAVHAPSTTPIAPRSLVDLALENAVEGARESWGAFVAAHQAIRAADEDVREVMREVARDEAEHAQWSADLAAWLDARLTDADRRRVAVARASAWSTFGEDGASELGLPPRSAVGLLAAALA